MNKVNFSKKSWHYRLASVYGGYNEYDAKNLCPYIRSVLIGLLVCSLIVTITVICIPPFILLTLAIFGSINLHFFPTGFDDAIIFVGFLEYVILAIYLLAILLTTETRNNVSSAIDKITPDMSNSFITHAYKSFKDKTCVQLAFFNEVVDPNTPRKLVMACRIVEENVYTFSVQDYVVFSTTGPRNLPDYITSKFQYIYDITEEQTIINSDNLWSSECRILQESRDAITIDWNIISDPNFDPNEYIKEIK